MPGYEEHSRRAVQVGVVSAVVVAAVALYLTWMPVVAGVTAVLAFVGARVGGNAPDIDSHSSIPRRYFDRSLQVLLATAILSASFLLYEQLLSVSRQIKSLVAPNLSFPPIVIGALGVVLLVLLGVRFLPRVVAWGMPSHRTTLHRPILWIGSGLGLGGLTAGGLLFVGVELVVAGLVGAALGGGLTAGALFAHLLPDGELF